MTTTALTVHNGAGNIAAYAPDWAREQEKLDLLKRTFAAGTSNDEFELFVEVARSSGLNPFQRQIYAIMRRVKNRDTGQWESRMTIQTGIDGYRLIAARTGLHAGTSDAEFGPVNQAGQPEWARVTVKRLLPGGHIAEFTATARWAEYVQTDRNGNPSGMWEKMPFNQLAKCAEALSLRKAFPAELSGIYTAEEMAQADSAAYAPAVATVPDNGTHNTPSWKTASSRFRAIQAEARKALDLPGTTLAELCKEFMANNFDGRRSTTELNASELHRLADLIEADPKILIGTPTGSASMVDDDIPPFDPENPVT